MVEFYSLPISLLGFIIFNFMGTWVYISTWFCRLPKDKLHAPCESRGG